MRIRGYNQADLSAPIRWQSFVVAITCLLGGSWQGAHLEIVTLSGHQLKVEDERCGVLLDASDKDLVVGQKLVYSGGRWIVGVAHYRIEARALKVTS